MSSFAFFTIFFAKNYNHIFEFVKVMSKKLSVLFFPDTDPKTAFSMTSQLCYHYVVSCKYWWDILKFFSHTDCQDDSRQKIMKSCLNFSKLWPKYCSVGLFFRTRYITLNFSCLSFSQSKLKLYLFIYFIYFLVILCYHSFCHIFST